MENFFAYMARMKYIGRWSLMRSAVPENIQEHSHMVAVITHALALIRRDVCGVPCDPADYVAVALYHDASEILTGDLPTPIKYHSPEIQAAYRDVERIANEKLLETLPAALQGSFREILCGPTHDRVYDLVKAADKISAYIKCIEERRAGNDEFLSAEVATRASIEAMCLPEADYFLEHFIPAFSLTLDELGTFADAAAADAEAHRARETGNGAPEDAEAPAEGKPADVAVDGEATLC